MQQPNFTIQTLNAEAGYGKFVFEPLPQGFGHTLGNSLRRVLYSSIKGAAITLVKISGASHQFAAIEGVREDAVQLILALKQINVHYTQDKPIQITLSAKGQGEITAGQFETPAEVKIANPDLVIAHLADKNSKLEIEATVESGYGYSPAEERRSNTVGIIPMDASFTPVVRVNYTVEATRVGRVTNFDKLVMEIFTNGTVSPQTTLATAAQTLVNYFTAVVSPQADSASASGNGLSVAAPVSGSSSGVTVEELDLPTRIANALQKAGIENVSQLLSIPRQDLARVKNLGSKSTKIIEQALKERGIELSA